MDSIAHTRIAKFILNYAHTHYGVKFHQNSFVFGNLKPDLKGEYFTKRHNPSVMFEEVIEKIETFVSNYEGVLHQDTSYCVDLGEICHYLTDFFSYPHNDTIYEKGLFAHYVYEKTATVQMFAFLNRKKFKDLVAKSDSIYSVDDLILKIRQLHNEYLTETEKHSIKNDLTSISQVCMLFVISIMKIMSTEELLQPA